MKRSHRIALKPTPKQETLFGQHSGYARFAYNWAVGEFRAGFDLGSCPASIILAGSCCLTGKCYRKLSTLDRPPPAPFPAFRLGQTA